MRVIGISPLDKDSTVSFMEDGNILFACGEERLSRTKLQDGFPDRALALGFERTGWTPDSVDVVAYAFFDGAEEARLMREAFDKDAAVNGPQCTAGSLAELKNLIASGYESKIPSLIPGFDKESDEFMPSKGWLKTKLYDWVAASPKLDWKMHRRFFKDWVDTATADHALRTQQLQEGLEKHGLAGKLQRFNHHDTHAANSFFMSGYEEALVVTLDGYGSGNCGGVYVGNKEGVEALHKFAFPNSLGQYYELVTSALGFKPGRHEGKIVGLAAYGDPEVLAPTLRERFDTTGGDIVIRASLNYWFARALAQRFSKRDVAAAYQSVLEEITKKVVTEWVEKTGMKNVTVSGGVNANVKLNQRIHEIDGVQSVFVYPNMGDGGCGSGAAMLAFKTETFHDRAPLANAYLGPDYSDDVIEAALKKAELDFERHEGVEESIGQLLAENRIIGRFNGRMEYGPRALGNRSVLYPAQDPEVNLWLNHQLGRTEFMPFAPAALASEAHRLFKNIEGCEKTAEFMTVTFDCTEEMCQMCPAAVHVDKTARPQLVSEETNPSFHRILRSYFEKTGIPAVINTSFNMHEEPIVCSPEDAIRAFLLGRLDYLAIGSFLVPHPRLAEIEKERQVKEGVAS